MITCPKCGEVVSGGTSYCLRCGEKIGSNTSKAVSNQANKPKPTSSQPITQKNVSAISQPTKMKFCYNCGSKIVEGHSFCPNCGAHIANSQPVTAPQPQTIQSTVNTTNPTAYGQKAYAVQAVGTTTQNTSTRIKKVNIQKGRYIGRKWFIKLAYKKYETDVEFFDEHMLLSQGTGFATVGYKVPTRIDYTSIYGVTTGKKFSIPNVIFAIVVAVIAVAMQVWAALLISLLVFWLGKTAVANISYSGGVYVVPTEFISEADELKNKIDTAVGLTRR